MAQQTAVDWFYQRILAEDIKKVFKQAKKREKEQILYAHLNGQAEFDKGVMRSQLFENAEQYYNEIYKKD